MLLYFLLKKHIQNFCSLLDKLINNLGKIIEKGLVLIFIFILFFMAIYGIINVLNLGFLSLCGILEVYKIHLSSFFCELEAMPMPLNWDKIKAYHKLFAYSHHRLLTSNYLNYMEYKLISKVIVKELKCGFLPLISYEKSLFLRDLVSSRSFYNNAVLLNNVNFEFKEDLMGFFFDKTEINRLCNYVKLGLNKHYQIWVPLLNSNGSYSLIGLVLTSYPTGNCKTCNLELLNNNIALSNIFLMEGHVPLKSKHQYISTIGYIWDNMNPLFFSKNGGFNFDFFESMGIKLRWLKDIPVGQDPYFLNIFLSEDSNIIDVTSKNIIKNYNHINLRELDLELSKKFLQMDYDGLKNKKVDIDLFFKPIKDK